MAAVKRIFVAGHGGMVGAALLRQLQSHASIDQAQVFLCRTSAELDLRQQAAVQAFFLEHDIDEVYLAAAKVGGIHANNEYPADFLYDNLMIAANVIEAAHQAGIKKLLFLGSSCIYPKHAGQPMAEPALLSGYLEPTNEPYAIAKIAGIKLCESYRRQYDRDYRALMPTNLYGPNDNFHPQQSHVIPGLIQRFHLAKLQQEPVVTVWGSGQPRREFLYVDDMAAACVHVMGLSQADYQRHTAPRCRHLNVGSGSDCTIAELAAMIAEVVGYQGQIQFDPTQPDGTPRKLMDVSRITALGWRARTPLLAGLQTTYQWFLANELHYRGALA